MRERVFSFLNLDDEHRTPARVFEFFILCLIALNVLAVVGGSAFSLFRLESSHQDWLSRQGRGQRRLPLVRIAGTGSNR